MTRLVKKVDEWNDCEKCKNFEECYYYAAGNHRVLDSAQWTINSTRKRDLCVNNGKKLFKAKK